MRNLVAIFFLLIFSFQVVPVKVIGKFLSKNQQTEEVKDDCSNADDDTKDDNTDSSKEGKYSDLFHHYTFSAYTHISLLTRKTSTIHSSDDLPNSHVTEIHCPPPNC